jgi:Zn-dependent M32 family carboxypeptidase
MPLRESRSRAERVFLMRAVGQQPWSKIRDELGFGSVGAAQMAHRRYLKRNPVPDSKSVLAEILERKRALTEQAIAALTKAQNAGDFQSVAALIRTVTQSDAELARMFGLSQQTVNVTIKQSPSEIIAEAQARLLAVIDAEVIDERKEIGQ